jgi:hypothetical protein
MTRTLVLFFCFSTVAAAKIEMPRLDTFRSYFETFGDAILIISTIVAAATAIRSAFRALQRSNSSENAGLNSMFHPDLGNDDVRGSVFALLRAIDLDDLRSVPVPADPSLTATWASWSNNDYAGLVNAVSRHERLRIVRLAQMYATTDAALFVVTGALEDARNKAAERSHWISPADRYELLFRDWYLPEGITKADIISRMEVLFKGLMDSGMSFDTEGLGASRWSSWTGFEKWLHDRYGPKDKHVAAPERNAWGSFSDIPTLRTMLLSSFDNVPSSEELEASLRSLLPTTVITAPPAYEGPEKDNPEFPEFSGKIGDYRNWMLRVKAHIRADKDRYTSRQAAIYKLGCAMNGVAGEFFLNISGNVSAFYKGEDESANSVRDTVFNVVDTIGRNHYRIDDDYTWALSKLDDLTYWRRKTWLAFSFEWPCMCQRAGIDVFSNTAENTAGNSAVRSLRRILTKKAIKELIRLTQTEAQYWTYRDVWAYLQHGGWSYVHTGFRGAAKTPAGAKGNKAASAPEKNARNVPVNSQTGAATYTISLPAECAHHTDQIGCPKTLLCALGAWGSEGRLARIAALRELGRCEVCRGLLREGERSPRRRTATPSPSPAPTFPRGSYATPDIRDLGVGERQTPVPPYSPPHPVQKWQQQVPPGSPAPPSVASSGLSSVPSRFTPGSWASTIASGSSTLGPLSSQAGARIRRLPRRPAAGERASLRRWGYDCDELTDEEVIAVLEELENGSEQLQRVEELAEDGSVLSSTGSSFGSSVLCSCFGSGSCSACKKYFR